MTDGQSETARWQHADTLPKQPHHGTTGNDGRMMEVATIARQIKSHADEVRKAAVDAASCERESNLFMSYALRVTRHQAEIVRLVGELLDLDSCPYVDAEGISGDVGVEDMLAEGGQ